MRGCTAAVAQLQLELGGAGAAGGPVRRSVAVLLLNAGHQLLLGAVVHDGRLPLRPPVAAARGPASRKHRQGVRRQDVTFDLSVSAGQPPAPLQNSDHALPWGHPPGLWPEQASACPRASFRPYLPRPCLLGRVRAPRQGGPSSNPDPSTY